jgi:hypothetical protein
LIEYNHLGKLKCTLGLLILLIAVVSVSPVRGDFPDWSPSLAVKVTSPQKLSVSIGISSISWGSVWGGGSGVVFRVEPGLAGGKIHLGIRSAFSMLFIPVMSVDVSGSLMHTWNDPWYGLENDQTYAGVELRSGAHLLVVSAGVYRHIAGTDAEHDWVFSGGAGVGF